MAATPSPEYASQLRFCRALDIVRSFPLNSHDSRAQLLEPSAADKLSLYALYKQATQGNCNTPRPSSRQVVEYAKWKAWDRMRGMSPVEAQRLYVNGIVELLSQFITQYPEHEQAQELADSLRYLEPQQDSPTDTNDTFVDAWDPSDFEKEQDMQRLTHLEPHHLMSPPPLSLNGSRRLSHSNNSRYAPSSPSLISTSTATHNEVPMTPEIYPAHYRHYSISSHHSKKSHPQSHSQPQHRPLLLQSPPLPSRPMPLSRTTTSSHHDDSIKTDDEHRSSRQETASPSSETAVENLQTEVTALSEQIEKLRRGMAAEDARKRTSKRVLVLWFIKTLVKHAVVNSIILLITFAVLWHRRSPMADIVLAYAKPRIQRFMRLLLSRVVLWRVTV